MRQDTQHLHSDRHHNRLFAEGRRYARACDGSAVRIAHVACVKRHMPYEQARRGARHVTRVDSARLLDSAMKEIRGGARGGMRW